MELLCGCNKIEGKKRCCSKKKEDQEKEEEEGGKKGGRRRKERECQGGKQLLALLGSSGWSVS